MKHFWRLTSENNNPTGGKLKRSTAYTGIVGEDTCYKVETLEYMSGKVTSVLFVAEGGAVIGKNMLQVSYDAGSVRVTPEITADIPQISSSEEAAIILRDFVISYAESLAVMDPALDYDNDDEEAADVVYGKHMKIVA